MLEKTNATEVDRLLKATRQTMAKVSDCWAATPAADGGVNARIVQPIDAAPDDGDWTICFITGARTRKAAEIARAGRMTLCYQHHPDRSYVVLSGHAALVAERSEIRARWREPWRLFFPGGADDLVLVRLAVERIELCVPGVSPEPFGIRYAALTRDATGCWRIRPA
jgi:general stress protein 26